MHAIFSQVAVSIALAAAPANQTTTALSAESIRSLVTELGSANFMKREEATQQLWEAGPIAEPALLEAENSPDAEVRRRARSVLGRFRLGIYPDTPENVVSLIRQFTSGDSMAKQRAFSDLLECDEIKTAIRLLRQDAPSELTHELKSDLAKQIQRLVGTLPSIDHPPAELTDAVRLAAFDDDGRRRLAAFLSLTGNVDAEIRRLRTDGDDLESSDLRQLFFLYRVSGDRTAMLATAAKTGDSDLLEAALIESGRWSQLNEVLKANDAAPPDDFFEHLKTLGRRAVFAKYANDTKGCDAAIAELKELATRQPDETWSCARALLLCEKINSAEQLLKENDAGSLIEVYRFQNRYDDLFAVLGVDDPRSPPTPWMATIKTDATDEDRERRFFKGLTVAGLLDSVGYRNIAIRLLDELYEAATSDHALSPHEVILEEFAIGLDERAFDHVEALLENNQPSVVLNTLFAARASAAELLWRAQLESPERPSPRVKIEFIHRIFNGEPTPDDLSILERLLRKTIARVDESETGQILGEQLREDIHVLCGLAASLDKPNWAIELLETAAPFNEENVRAQLTLADLYADQEDWPSAVKHYRKAHESDPTNAVAAFFYGDALTKSGETEKGERMMRLANVLPLHDASSRALLASAMERRELTEAGNRQWEFVLKSGRPGGWELDQAAQSLASNLGESDPALAAHLWRRLALRGVEPHTSFGAVRHYITLPAMVRRCQIREAFAKAEYDAVVAHLDILADLAPGDTTVALDFVPPLDAAGQSKVADTVFERAYSYHDSLCQAYPSSAMHLNNLAWMCAKCDRRLDDAFAKSRHAVELDPKPAYLDTLAELHFMRGEIGEAITLEKRCIELDPHEPIYREQLERFQR
jgi:tetratricopeptide (TPR) repeat protein